MIARYCGLFAVSTVFFASALTAQVSMPDSGHLKTHKIDSAQERARKEMTAVKEEKEAEFKDVEWHHQRWQNSPALIEITDKHINLLFNRPEKVFALRRGICFAWQDTHEYSDGKVVTTYRFSRLQDGRAKVFYTSVMTDDPARTASGSFELEARR